MQLQKILIVEDDIHINKMLCELLRQNGYAPVAAYSGTEATMVLKVFTQRDELSLVLLDLMLPGMAGEQVLEEIRTVSNVPVIVLTARTDKETTVELLRLGADDYLGKPFDNNELLARIEVQLRRAPAAETSGEQLCYKDIVLDMEGLDALVNGQKAGLTKREFEILRLMMSHPKKVFSKNNIYESAWGGEFFGDDNNINVYISKMRAKLEAISPGEDYIKTIWGIGFKMNE